jgi:hypothetical protein
VPCPSTGFGRPEDSGRRSRRHPHLCGGRCGDYEQLRLGVMGVSGFVVLLLASCVLVSGAVRGTRLLRARADATLEETRRALRATPSEPAGARAREAVPALIEPPAPSAGPSPTTADARLATSGESSLPGRHRVPDALLYARTRPLSPDRIARARVPSPGHHVAAGRQDGPAGRAPARSSGSVHCTPQGGMPTRASRRGLPGAGNHRWT